MAARKPAQSKPTPAVEVVVEDTAPVIVAEEPNGDEPMGIPIAAPVEPSAPEVVVETKIQPHTEVREQYVQREGEPNGLILGPDDPVILEGEDTGTEVVISRDIFRRVYPRNTRRPTYILLYPKGARIAKSTLQRVNI
jgi:hypothetical protein